MSSIFKGSVARTSTIGFGVAAITLALAVASATMLRAEPDDDGPGGAAAGVVGSWQAIATPTSALLPPLATLMSFTRDGVVLEAHRPYLAASPLGPLLVTAGHGAWARGNGRDIVATLALIYEGAPNHPTAAGEVLASETVRFVLRVAGDRQTLTGTLDDEIRDNDGNLVFRGPGTIEATRINAR